MMMALRYGVARGVYANEAGYGTAACLARHLGNEDVACILEETLQEEKATDAKLTELAESSINADAAHAPSSGR